MQNASIIGASPMAATRGSGATVTSDTCGIATCTSALAMHGGVPGQPDNLHESG